MRTESPKNAIIHLDADAFFASVEQASDPRLRGRAMAVGGEKRGIIASASYEARRYGVYTPMPTARARKRCPGLIVVPGDFEKYERFSQWMFSYAYDFTPAVEIASIDEGYFDLTGAKGSPLEIAKTIRKAIAQALKISVSEGLAANKLVSQVASKLRKPAAFIAVPTGEEGRFLAPLPNRRLPGLGPKTAQRFDLAGLRLIGQIAATPEDRLALLVGSWAPQLKQFAAGIDPRPVVPVRAPAKSYSMQETFAEDVTDEVFVEATLRGMADRLMARVRHDGKQIRTLTVKVRYNDFAEDQRSESLSEPTDLETDVYGRLHALLRDAWRRRVSLRMVSLRLSKVYTGGFQERLLLGDDEQKRARQRTLAETLDRLREDRGRYVVMRGHDLRLKKSPPAGLSRRGPSSGGTGAGARPKRSSRRDKPAGDGNEAEPIQSLPLLHVHSYYSFLDSTLSPEAIIEQAARHGIPAVALTDTANLHGAVRFVLAAQAAGIKPIIGAEIRINGAPLLLYAKNEQGYRNL